MNITTKCSDTVTSQFSLQMIFEQRRGHQLWPMQAAGCKGHKASVTNDCLLRDCNSATCRHVIDESQALNVRGTPAAAALGRVCVCWGQGGIFFVYIDVAEHLTLPHFSVMTNAFTVTTYRLHHREGYFLTNYPNVEVGILHGVIILVLTVHMPGPLFKLLLLCVMRGVSVKQNELQFSIHNFSWRSLYFEKY